MKGVSLFFSIWQSDQEDEREAWFSLLFCCPGKRITSEERMQGFLSMKKQDEKRCISDTSFNFRSEKKKKYHLKIHFWTGWITWRVYSSQDSFFFHEPSFCIPRDNTSSWLVSFSSWNFCSFLYITWTGNTCCISLHSFFLLITKEAASDSCSSLSEYNDRKKRTDSCHVWDSLFCTKRSPFCPAKRSNDATEQQRLQLLCVLSEWKRETNFAVSFNPIHTQ